MPETSCISNQRLVCDVRPYSSPDESKAEEACALSTEAAGAFSEQNANLCPADPGSSYALKLYAEEAVHRLALDTSTSVESKVPPEEGNAEPPPSKAGAVVEGVYAFFGILHFIYNVLD